MANYKYYSYKNKILGDTKAKIKIANRRIGEDILKTSRMSTPMNLTKQLRGQTHIGVVDNTVTIEWQVPYAQYQERGKRFDGSHPVKHYTTPGTGKGFARKAVEKVLTTENIQKYYK